MDIDVRVAAFLVDLEEQGFTCKTEPWENRSKIWGPTAFRTTIRKGRMSRHFDTCAGIGWSNRTNVEAFRTIQDMLRDVIGYDTYDTWSRDEKDYYSKQFGKRGARTYFTEMKQAETAIHEAIGDQMFEQFCNLDQ